MRGNDIVFMGHTSKKAHIIYAIPRGVNLCGTVAGKFKSGRTAARI